MKCSPHEAPKSSALRNDITSFTTGDIKQSQGIAQVNATVTQMDDATQQNAALVEEAAAAAQSLQDQAGRLAQVVSVFKLDETGQAPQQAVARPAPAKTARQAIAATPAARPQAPASDAWEEF